jgi:hypothetical protein
MVEKVEGGHKCRKKLRGDETEEGVLLPEQQRWGQFGGLEAVLILFDSFLL